jgi:hypothetical protein
MQLRIASRSDSWFANSEAWFPGQPGGRGRCSILQKMQVNFGRRMTKRQRPRKVGEFGKIAAVDAEESSHFDTLRRRRHGAFD